MPRLKQPTSLLKMAMDVLIDLLATNCNKCSKEDSLDKLRKYVASIKEDIGPYIPWQSAAHFYKWILEQFLYYDYEPLVRLRPESHNRAMFELIMDRELYALKCSRLELLDMRDAHRLQGLRELRLFSRHYNLELFQLGDLRVLEYFDFCTDSDLRVIGKNCPKLEFLNIQAARITDDALLALCSCHKLRDVFFNLCRHLTLKGIRDFVSAHGNVHRIQARFCSRGADFNGFAQIGWPVCPSVTELAITVDIENRDLRYIAERFPNLISLCISGNFYDSVDFSTLGSLDKLSALQLFPRGRLTWDHLKPLLILIGANITNLDTDCFADDSQSILDFLYKFCPNMERINCTHKAESDGEILVVPPFKRLKKLGIDVYHVDYPRFVGLQFGVMSMLEKLRLCRFRITTEILESIILDDIKFPNLVSVRLTDVPGYCDFNRIIKIVSNNNLLIHVEVEPLLTDE